MLVTPTLVDTRNAMLQVLRFLADQQYRFITPTPLTHSRVLATKQSPAQPTLTDVFGWSLPFNSDSLPPELLQSLRNAGVLTRQGERLACRIRVSSLGDDLFVHSSYPTQQDDAVFFGPDTYRFARFVEQAIKDWHGTAVTTNGPVSVLDVGCGSGAGAVAAARALAALNRASHLTLSDVNSLALQYSSANLAQSGFEFTCAQGDALAAVKGNFDLIISNPPYLNDAAQRAYRHGGERMGRALSARIAAEAIQRLTPGGTLLLYTGVAIADGVDGFLTEMTPVLDAAHCDWSYSEIDPDVFGEELEEPAYAHVDRIAAVGLVARLRND